jgi:hypothetical protein
MSKESNESDEIVYNISNIEKFRIFVLEFKSYFDNDYSLLDYTKIKNNYDILLDQLSNNIEIYYILKQKQINRIKNMCKDILKNIRDILHEIEYFEDKLECIIIEKEKPKIDIFGVHTIRSYIICLEPYKKLSILPGYFIQKSRYETLFYFNLYTNNYVNFPSMSDGFGLAIYIQDDKLNNLYTWLKRRNYISLIEGCSEQNKENTMNLSKQSEDKELFSGERSSKENTMNLSKLSEDKENTMNLSKLSKDKELFSIERYLFNKLIIKEVLSYIE